MPFVQQSPPEIADGSGGKTVRNKEESSLRLKKSWIVTLVFGVLLSFAASSAWAREAQLRLLHMNDFHGFVLPHKATGAEEEEGGIAYLAYQVKELRRQKPTLLLSAGDMIQGDNWANLFQGVSVIALMNTMSFDAMVLGNHEFDFGREVLEKLIAMARFPVLGANVTGVQGLKASVIKTKGGLKVGIIGVVAKNTPVTTHPRNVKGLTFIPPEEAVRRAVAKLRPQVDLIIVLSHMGYPEDRQLATQVKGIDVIVGGHSHIKLEKQAVVDGVIIAQAYQHGRVLGILDLTWRDGKIVRHEGRLLPIKPVPGQEEPAIAALVARYQDRVENLLGEQVGQIDVDLDGEQEHVRTRETNLGNLVADIMRIKAKADVALINGGGIRKSIAKGAVQRRDVYATLPFDNYLVALRLTGQQLRDTLEHGVSRVEDKSGRFPQVSGLSFTYNPQAPPGSRVKEVLVGGQLLDPKREYAVATNDFLAAGGDGFRAFGEALAGEDGYEQVGGMLKSSKLTYSDPARWIREDFIDYVAAHPHLAPRVEGRIRTVN